MNILKHLGYDSIWAMSDENMQRLMLRLGEDTDSSVDQEFPHYTNVALASSELIEIDKQGRMLQVSDGIAFISVNDGIFKGDFWGTGNLRKKLAFATASPKVKGAILRMDSPGGDTLATEELAIAVEKFKAVKPIVTQVEGLAASAGYWISSLTNKVNATPMSFLGSIGVFTMVVDMSKMLKKWGLKVTLVNDPDMKGEGFGVRKPSKAYMESVQKRVSLLADQFRSVVRENRTIAKEDEAVAFNADIFTASNAKDLGLVDSVQDMDTTIAEFKAELGPSGRSRSRMIQSNRVKLAAAV